jgi:hypothetical protein
MCRLRQPNESGFENDWDNRKNVLDMKRWISDDKELEMNIYIKHTDLVTAAVLLVLMA